MKGARLIVETLESIGVNNLFFNPGSTEIVLLDELFKSSIKCHLCLHELAAVSMADGFARKSKKLGVSLIHSGVGTGNAISPLLNAVADNIPVLVIAGIKEQELQNTNHFMEHPSLVEVVKPIVKEARQITHFKELERSLIDCIRIAHTLPQGPVFLAVPENILASESGERHYKYPKELNNQRSYSESDTDVTTIVELLCVAEKPLCVIGGQFFKDKGQAILAEISKVQQWPVVIEDRFNIDLLNIKELKEQVVGFLPMDAEIIEQADVILLLGAQFSNLYKAVNKKISAAIVHVLPDERKIGGYFGADQYIIGDSRSFLYKLHSYPKIANPNETLSRRRLDWVQKVTSNLCLSKNQNKIVKMAMILNKYLPDESYIFNDSITAGNEILTSIDYYAERYYLSSRGGCLGWGIAAAIGASIAEPSDRVVAIIGDGGLLFGVQALWTASRAKVPILFICLDNKGYMAIKFLAQKYAEVSKLMLSSAYIEDPEIDYVKLVESFGIDTAYCQTLDQFENEVKFGLNVNKPYFIFLNTKQTVDEV